MRHRWSIIMGTVAITLSALVVLVMVWPLKVYMTTRPTVTIEDIEDVVRSEAEERQQDNQEKAPGFAENAKSDQADSVLRSAHTNLEVQAAKIIEPEKTVVLYSWLGGKIVVKRVGTQLYLSLFK